VERDAAVLLGKLERIVEGSPGMVRAVNGDEKLVHVGALSWSSTKPSLKLPMQPLLDKEQVKMGVLLRAARKHSNAPPVRVLDERAYSSVTAR
jgi:hypothetical protein